MKWRRAWMPPSRHDIMEELYELKDSKSDRWVTEAQVDLLDRRLQRLEGSRGPV